MTSRQPKVSKAGTSCIDRNGYMASQGRAGQEKVRGQSEGEGSFNVREREE